MEWQERRQRSRRLIIDLHAWAGAVTGLFILCASLSGMLMLFSENLLQMETGALPEVGVGAEGIAPELDAYLEKARQAAGADFIPLGYLGPNSEIVTAAEMLYGLSAPPEAGGEIQIVTFNPATGEAMGSFLLDRTATHHVIEFHATLLAGELGAGFVAVVGLFMALLGVLGVYLWWPERGRVLRKLGSMRLAGSLQRKSWSLHSSFGFWLSLAVVVWAATGVQWSKPDWFPASFRASAEQPPEAFSNQRGAATCGASVSPGQALALALEQHPESRLVGAEFAAPWQPYHSFYLSVGNDLNRHDGDLQVWIAADCPEISASRALTSLGAVGAIGQSIHSGRIFGPFRIAVSLLIGGGLVLLSVTGLYLWWRRVTRRRPTFS